MGVGTLSRVPDRSLQQRRDALRHANEIRAKRARLKREMKAGRASLVSTLLRPPEFALTMKVYDLVLAAPSIGVIKAKNVLRICGLPASKTVGGLSDRQRRELVAVVSRRPLPTTVGRGDLEL